tara:strand:+ start:1290 stop:1646 length:357 start_codon:yes stop_codon:yes gene_type:complete
MPIYEYTCNECGKLSSKFYKVIPEKEPEGQTCAHCGSAEVSKDLPKISYIRSQSTRHESSGDPDAPGPDYWRDPSNIGRWAEKRLEENGVEMPESVREMIGQAREGEVDQILDKRGLD